MLHVLLYVHIVVDGTTVIGDRNTSYIILVDMQE